MNGQLTLTELSEQIKEALLDVFPEQLWVVAEIGELKVNRAGHCYLELVEKNPDTNEITARIRGTIWSWQFRFMKPYFETITGQELTSGIKVLFAVSVEYHEVYGISLNVKDIDPNYTLGDLARKRQEVIAKLIEEGIFEMNKELDLPEIPSHIAVISSPNAAGYEDFMKQLHSNPRGFSFHTQLFPATMQGNDAPASIINALEQVFEEADNFDVAVIIRGGGSQMDLLCFDDYDLAFHITQFPLPILTGIGHEKDESVSDLVAHTRLKTPTAVAEFLIGRMNEVDKILDEIEARFVSEVVSLLEEKENELAQAARLFKPLVLGRLKESQMEYSQLSARATHAVSVNLKKNRHQLENLSHKIASATNAHLRDRQHELTTLQSNASFKSKLMTSRRAMELHEKQAHFKHVSQKAISQWQHQLSMLEQNMQLVDPKNILKRGFSITLKNGKAVKEVALLGEGNEIETILYDGKVKSKITKQ